MEDLSYPTPSVDAVNQLLKSGKNVKIVSEHFHVTRGDMKQFIIDNDLVGDIIDKNYWIWDDAEDKALEQQVENGLSLSDIAERHSRSEGAIISRMSMMKLSFPRGSPSYVKPVKWTNDDEIKLMNLVESGKTLSEISKELDRGSKSIQTKCRNLRKMGHQIPSITKPSRGKKSSAKLKLPTDSPKKSVKVTKKASNSKPTKKSKPKKEKVPTHLETCNNCRGSLQQMFRCYHTDCSDCDTDEVQVCFEKFVHEISQTNLI